MRYLPAPYLHNGSNFIQHSLIVSEWLSQPLILLVAPSLKAARLYAEACMVMQLIEEVTRNKRLQRFKAIIAAWQRVLPEMFPAMKVCNSESACMGHHTHFIKAL